MRAVVMGAEDEGGDSRPPDETEIGGAHKRKFEQTDLEEPKALAPAAHAGEAEGDNDDNHDAQHVAKRNRDASIPRVMDPPIKRLSQPIEDPPMRRLPKAVDVDTQSYDEGALDKNSASERKALPESDHPYQNEPARNDTGASSMSNERRAVDAQHDLSAPIRSALESVYALGACTPGDIDSRMCEYLSGLPVSTAVACIEEIPNKDMSMVRNRPAFLMSVFKRVANPPRAGPPSFASSPPRKSGGTRQPQGSPRGAAAITAARSGSPNPYGSEFPVPPPLPHPPVAQVPPESIAHLPAPVGSALQYVFASGVCHPSQFDERAMEVLMEMPDLEAVEALYEFAAIPPGQLRNPSAFWVGLVKRHMQKTALPPPRADMHVHGTNRYGHGNQHQQQNWKDLDGSTQIVASVHKAAVQAKLSLLIRQGKISHRDLDSRVVDAINRLQDAETDAFITGLNQMDPTRIRNRNVGGFLIGLCRRVSSANDTTRLPVPLRGEWSDAPETPLDPQVDAKFQQLVRDQLIGPADFDARASNALRAMLPSEAIAALEELERSDPTRVRNVSAYFMSLMCMITRSHFQNPSLMALCILPPSMFARKRKLTNMLTSSIVGHPSSRPKSWSDLSHFTTCSR
ncbi:hypothetical protein FVE85_4183 [Porphyridium purpureum]|uniref:Heterogeneous nuclear ribonucleoprotein Q acidic domain-containing protein n=1 Tax=Porphyridium purpureum TaxID=35688 RepID=A0A5J4YSE9_PORPP|nr:hypothetical protein FVE85_4183 [Porphyridium purpureum]|eukprot:POR4126..scf229_5